MYQGFVLFMFSVPICALIIGLKYICKKEKKAKDTFKSLIHEPGILVWRITVAKNNSVDSFPMGVNYNYLLIIFSLCI